MNDNWQFSELNLFLNKHTQDDLIDTESIYLSNPKYRLKIDKVLANNIWPSVKKGVQESAISATLANDKESIYDSIQEEWRVYTTKTLTFMLSDPERPIGAGNTKWFCRGKIQCSAIDYMISFDFYIYFPLSFDMKKILFLLKTSDFYGMPPVLSYEEGLEDEGIFVLKFSKGYGVGGGGLFDYIEQAEAHAFHEVKNNLNLIYVLNTLEVDFDRKKSFDKLCEALVLAYECK